MTQKITGQGKVCPKYVSDKENVYAKYVRTFITQREDKNLT